MNAEANVPEETITPEEFPVAPEPDDTPAASAVASAAGTVPEQPYVFPIWPGTVAFGSEFGLQDIWGSLAAAQSTGPDGAAQSEFYKRLVKRPKLNGYKICRYCWR